MNTAGEVTWTGSQLTLANLAVINNTGYWESIVDQTFGPWHGGGGDFDNFGFFVKSGGNAKTVVEVYFLNSSSGTLLVDSSDVVLEGGGADSGRVYVAQGSALFFGGGYFALKNGTIFPGQNAGLIFQTAGEVSINAATIMSQFELDGGRLTVAVDGYLTAGRVTVGSGTTLDDQGGMDVSGLFTVAGTLTLEPNSELYMEAGSTLEDTGTMTVGGNLTVGSGTTLDDQGATAVPGGLFMVAGTLTLKPNSQLYMGAASTLDDFGTVTVVGNLTVMGNLELSGNGTLDDQAAVTILSGGTLLDNATVTVDYGATLDDQGTVTVRGQLTVAGVLVAEQDAILDVVGGILDDKFYVKVANTLSVTTRGRKGGAECGAYCGCVVQYGHRDGGGRDSKRGSADHRFRQHKHAWRQYNRFL